MTFIDTKSVAIRSVEIRSIEIRGARTHNLCNIDLTLPRDKLIVFTGLSGSGKSSLAVQTINSQGHRPDLETFWAQPPPKN
jgi:excinuclease ABC subunit A